MKVQDLDYGKFYNCELSGMKVLIVESHMIEPQAEGEEPKKTKIKAGKVAITNNGIPQFMIIELHDGQLTE